MLQATLSDRLFLDLFPFSENGFIAAKVDVGGVLSDECEPVSV